MYYGKNIVLGYAGKTVHYNLYENKYLVQKYL